MWPRDENAQMPADDVHRLEIQHTGRDGDAVGFAVVGSGPPLLYLLGYLPPIRAQWYLAAVRRFIEALATEWRVILIDDRHYVEGQSEADQPIPDGFLDQAVADIVAVIEAAGDGRCPVITSFLGTIPAVALAARHPESVESLLLWDGVLSGAAAVTTPNAKGLLELSKTKDPSMATRAWVGLTGMTGNTGEVEEYRRMFTATRDAPPWARIAVRGLAGSDAASDASAVRCPTLVVAPDAAIIPGSAAVEALARAIPGARLTRVPSAAIAPHLEEPAEVIPLILRWLAESSDDESPPLVTRPQGLTPREFEVCEQVALGRTNLEIGEALSISRWTVQRHVSNAIRKTGASNRAGLAALVAETRTG